jgi:mRNA interferase RelE/StbE
VAYEIRFKPSAEKVLATLPRVHQFQILRRLEAVAENPRPPGVEKLKGATEELYRVRQGDYRIVYLIRAAALLVVIVRIGHRRVERHGAAAGERRLVAGGAGVGPGRSGTGRAYQHQVQ